MSPNPARRSPAWSISSKPRRPDSRQTARLMRPHPGFSFRIKNWKFLPDVRLSRKLTTQVTADQFLTIPQLSCWEIDLHLFDPAKLFVGIWVKCLETDNLARNGMKWSGHKRGRVVRLADAATTESGGIENLRMGQISFAVRRPRTRSSIFQCRLRPCCFAEGQSAA